MTVEVYLFENQTESKPSYEEVKSAVQRSPFNKSVESVGNCWKIDSSTSNSKLWVPVYQKYISQAQKAGPCGNLQEQYKKMHSSIMNSFISSSNDQTLLTSKPSSHQKGSSSFIFASKSPLSTAKSAWSKNFIMKNKKWVKGSYNEEIKKKNTKESNKTKRSSSKKSTSAYSTSKLKNSFAGSTKHCERAKMIKYNSFINSCRMSPAHNRSTERGGHKKSQRKMELSTKRSILGSRKKSQWGPSSSKNSVPSSITNTVRKQPKELTRNIPKMEDFEPKTNYSAIMESYSEMIAKKRKAHKKCHKKELSKSFYQHYKKSI